MQQNLMLNDDLIKNIAIQDDFAITRVVNSVGNGVMCPKTEDIIDFGLCIYEFALPHEKAQFCESSITQFGGTFC